MAGHDDPWREPGTGDHVNEAADGAVSSTTASWPPPGGTAARSGTEPVHGRKPKRPAWILVVLLAAAVRLGRQEVGILFGPLGAVIAFVAFAALAIGWRLFIRRRARREGVHEHTPAMIRDQLASSGVAPPAFVEDGSLLGSSVLAVNQRSKLIEVVTEYEVFGWNGEQVGHVRQIGQGKAKKFFRFAAAFDQLYTHHFEIIDRSGGVVMKITRPRKWFKSRVHVYDGWDRPVGQVVQQNVFGKIRFEIITVDGQVVARLLAENWRAWDFRVEVPGGAEIARITKTWEGYARTYLTSADHYVVRVHQPLGDPLRMLVMATALTVDVALKQDPRGIGIG